MKYIALALALLASPAASQVACGGSFNGFVGKMKKAAIAKGHAPATVDKFFGSARQDGKVLKADRSQGVFKRDFIDFSRRVISKNRIQNATRRPARLLGSGN